MVSFLKTNLGDESYPTDPICYPTCLLQDSLHPERQHYCHITSKYAVNNFLFLWGRPEGSRELGLLIYLCKTLLQGTRIWWCLWLAEFSLLPYKVKSCKLTFLYYEGTRLSAIRCWVHLSQVLKLFKLIFQNIGTWSLFLVLNKKQNFWSNSSTVWKY